MNKKYLNYYYTHFIGKTEEFRSNKNGTYNKIIIISREKKSIFLHICIRNTLLKLNKIYIKVFLGSFFWFLGRFLMNFFV